ncbi:MAG TPA: hypothetical protein VG815_18790 [Chloroflexota bacterium]|jgi:hypothetical protein|nr:hypothetical protein [Chloroflexota bacterium]
MCKRVQIIMNFLLVFVASGSLAVPTPANASTYGRVKPDVAQTLRLSFETIQRLRTFHFRLVTRTRIATLRHAKAPHVTIGILQTTGDFATRRGGWVRYRTDIQATDLWDHARRRGFEQFVITPRGFAVRAGGILDQPRRWVCTHQLLPSRSVLTSVALNPLEFSEGKTRVVGLKEVRGLRAWIVRVNLTPAEVGTVLPWRRQGAGHATFFIATKNYRLLAVKLSVAPVSDGISRTRSTSWAAITGYGQNDHYWIPPKCAGRL